MRNVFILIVLSAAALPAADNGTSTKTAASAPSAQAAAAPQPLTIPKEATANPDGTFSYTDAQGQKWIYRKTPLGATRETAEAARKDANLTTATDLGDSVRFDVPTPLGFKRSVVKKKADLNAAERALVKAQLGDKALENTGSHE